MNHISVQCAHCGELVKQNPCNIRRTLKAGGRVYCNRACYGLASRKPGGKQSPTPATFDDYMAHYDALMARQWSVAFNGYLTVRARIGGKAFRIYQHRLVMQRALGREMTPDELVHHLDGCKTNNVLSNLALTNASDHAKEHLLERMAVRPAHPLGRFT